jgi:arsenate reductase (thioredoxin)
MRGSGRLSPRKPLESAGTADRAPGAESGRTPSRTPGPTSGQTTGHVVGKKRVLFVCIGNSCRSQMAEAFARAYGTDVVIASSAGLNPASIISPLTRQVLSEKKIPIDDQFPKGMEMAMREPFDVVVNMSGLPMTVKADHVVTWKVQDPIGYDATMFRTVAAQVEELVMRLIIELRVGK